MVWILFPKQLIRYYTRLHRPLKDYPIPTPEKVRAGGIIALIL